MYLVINYEVTPIVLVVMFFGILLCKRYFSQAKEDTVHPIIFLLLTLLTLASSLLFYRQDPRISSTILPITDDSFIRSQANFCLSCKLLKQP